MATILETCSFLHLFFRSPENTLHLMRIFNFIGIYLVKRKSQSILIIIFLWQGWRKKKLAREKCVTQSETCHFSDICTKFMFMLRHFQSVGLIASHFVSGVCDENDFRSAIIKLAAGNYASLYAHLVSIFCSWAFLRCFDEQMLSYIVIVSSQVRAVK